MTNIDNLFDIVSKDISEFNNKISNGIRLSAEESKTFSYSLSIFPLLEQYKKNKDDFDFASSQPESFDSTFVVDLENEIKELESAINQKIYTHSHQIVSEFIIEIRAGAGGDEASLFVKDIFNAYAKYLNNNRYSFEILDVSENDSTGFSFISVQIKNIVAYDLLQNEGGVHRVQRVPKTESSGRIHTSTISIAILPINEESEFEINPSDLKIDVYRSSGNGGQSVNTTDSAVRITHLPTGVVVTCQNTKSQIKNKEMALKVLKARLAQEQKNKLSKSVNDIRNMQIQNADRSEKIRTYNYLQDRITDHRVKLDFSNIPKFMEGSIDSILNTINKALEQVS